MKRQATDVWYNVRKDGCLPNAEYAKRRLEDEVITRALRFLFTSNNIQLMAWGTKRLKIRGGNRRFPMLVRKACIEKIWRVYKEHSLTGNDSGKSMSRTTFTTIVSTLTTGDIEQRACVDYKLHVLVYENPSTLKKIIEDQITVIDKRKELKKT